MDWLGKQRRQRKIREFREKFRWKYENLRNLLRLNNDLMTTLSDIQSFVGRGTPSDAYTYYQISELSDGIVLMIENLNVLTDNQFTGLYRKHRDITGKLQVALQKTRISEESRLALPLSLTNLSHQSEVGGKAAFLGELSRVFPDNVPKGFAVTTAAYQMLLNDNNLSGQIRALYSQIDTEDHKRAEKVCAEISLYVRNALIPDLVTDEIDEQQKAIAGDREIRWAVRSSAQGEDGDFSFAGQFDSILNVPCDKLTSAYLQVITSRFNTNAVIYRLSMNIKEAESSMAVLFIPMIEAQSSGVLYTRDPHAPDGNQLIITSVNGLAADLVGGQVEADLTYIDRDKMRVIKQTVGRKGTKLVPSEDEGLTTQPLEESAQNTMSLSKEHALELAGMAIKVEKYFGVPKDIEWAIDGQGKCWLLQTRPLQTGDRQEHELPDVTECPMLAEGGSTIFPGRAQGPLQYLDSVDKLDEVKDGVILLVRHASPRIVAVFPRIAGVIAEGGLLAGHAATVAREYGLPTLFGLKDAIEILKDATEVGIDVSRRKVFAGLPWPELPRRERTRAATSGEDSHEIGRLVFRLELTDPGAANFTPAECSSLHDIIRFVHEKAVGALFNLGDSQVENLKESFKVLDSPVQLPLVVLDTGGTISDEYADRKKVPPEGINSVPFQAMWRGIAHPRIKWTGRTGITITGLASVVMTSMTDDVNAMRQLGDRNYLIVSPEYFNMNARLAYHYSMVDALVGDRPLSNYVSFRFRGGGAARSRRALRGRFITGVLRHLGFSVDQREDLVTAWFKGFDRQACEERLEALGKLMGCARQMDMLFSSADNVQYFIQQFIDGNYEEFH